MSVRCSFRLFAELVGDGGMVLYEEDSRQQDKCGKSYLRQCLMNPFCHLRTVTLCEYTGYNGKEHQGQVLYDEAAYREMDVYVQIVVYIVCGEFHNHGDGE